MQILSVEPNTKKPIACTPPHQQTMPDEEPVEGTSEQSNSNETDEMYEEEVDSADAPILFQEEEEEASYSASYEENCGQEEDEVCRKLIQLSFAKIVSSKSERGGAKLHKNLLILHLLQKARHENSGRSDSSSTNPFDVLNDSDDNHETEEEEEEETSDGPTLLCLLAPQSADDSEDRTNNHCDDSGVVFEEILTSVHSGSDVMLGGAAQELPWTVPNAVHIAAPVVDQQRSGSISPPELSSDLFGDDEEEGGPKVIVRSNADLFLPAAIYCHPPIASDEHRDEPESSGDELPSSPSSGETTEEEEEDEPPLPFGDAQKHVRRRKRKREISQSSSSNCPSSVLGGGDAWSSQNKKFCLLEDETSAHNTSSSSGISGLISVFSSVCACEPPSAATDERGTEDDASSPPPRSFSCPSFVACGSS